MRMPVVDGYQAFRQIWKWSRGTTSHRRLLKEQFPEILAVGCDDYGRQAF